MTPAEVLAAAADKLDALASGATPELRLDDVESGLFPEDISYIEAMNPLVGKALAGMLRTFGSEYVRETRHFHAMWNEAQRERMIGDKFPGFTEALALARLIIGGES